MELDELEQSAKSLNMVLNKFPIGAISLNDFKPVEEKIQTARESLMHLNARLLMLQAKYKQYTDDGQRQQEEESTGVALQNITSDTLINAKAIKLCLHSITILSILSNKEGDVEDQNKLYSYMSKLLAFNDSIMTTQEVIEKESRLQLDLKVECHKALFEYKNFLKEQEQIRSERLQETYPEIVERKNKMEKTLRKINIMKKLIRNFIASSSHMLVEQPILLEMLEKHRELINVETILKISQNRENIEDV
ncbi:uncharacterized protein LOC126851334 [Cataglyphis hispanica]|uniref:uncharacterized protein LOC126851334 n=1 Tax=Cataglyphis hispanica TaxID=1086592 RepID=UPI0021802AE6|nr:uncharacterized protein LOC126851334 [Cataglyphis hispanica]